MPERSWSIQELVLELPRLVEAVTAKHLVGVEHPLNVVGRDFTAGDTIPKMIISDGVNQHQPFLPEIHHLKLSYSSNTFFGRVIPACALSFLVLV
jgi:hypothetical protein